MSMEDLLVLSADIVGNTKTMTLADALRLAITSYKLGHHDGVMNAKAYKEKENTKEEPLPTQLPSGGP